MSTSVESEFRRRLRLIMQQFGSVADLAKAVGVSDNAIYKWVSGRGQPGMSSLVNLARAAGVSVEWLATGQGSTKILLDQPRTPEASIFYSTPRHALALPEAGTVLESFQVVDYLHFHQNWFQKNLGVDVARVVLIETRGDSMAPTIDDGDLCLVDLAEGRFKHDGLYALRDGIDLAIKRLQREPDGSLMLLSDNPVYQPIRVAADEITIIGRVIWLSGKP
jgi:phage repressor protein C with HTH and peptisase S24 domain